MEKMLTPQEIADILKIKKTTVYEMIKRGELPSSKIGKQLRVRETDFGVYLKNVTALESAENVAQDKPEALAESSLLKQDYLKNMSGLVISGQNPLMDLLCAHIESESEGCPVLRSVQNSYNSLYALYFEKIHAACVAFGGRERNTAYIQRMTPGMDLLRIHLAKTQYGLYTDKENTKTIEKIADIARPDVQLINRERGATSRILMDLGLSRERIAQEKINGYHKEVLSDLACAAAIMSGKADVALGAAYTLGQFPDLNFIPLQEVHLELVFDKKYLDYPAFKIIPEIIQSEVFKAEIASIYACDASQTGEYCS